MKRIVLVSASLSLAFATTGFARPAEAGFWNRIKRGVKRLARRAKKGVRVPNKRGRPSRAKRPKHVGAVVAKAKAWVRPKKRRVGRILSASPPPTPKRNPKPKR